MTDTTELSLQQHPLSAAFPSMSEDDLAALESDMASHGQREPGVLYDGMVLDGWHRYLACCHLGFEFKAVEFEGDDPVAFVISKNLHRRHLTASQRAAAIVATANWKPVGANQHGGSAPGAYPQSLSEKQMAEAAEVSPRTIRDAKVAHQAGLGDAVKEGQLSAKDAAMLAKGKPAKKPSPDLPPEEHAPDLADELDRADKQILEQQELIESLKKGDLAKEVAKWKQKYDQLNGRVQQLATTTAEAKKTAQYQADLLAKIRKALKVEKNSEILPALK